MHSREGRMAVKHTEAVAFLLAFALFVLFFNLGGRSIENNDYPHYAEIGREILETGDWVIMHSGGEMYVDKPPLHTAFIALSYKLFGVNAFAGRLPSALFALIGVCATLAFGLRLDKRQWRTGVYAAMILLSSYGFFFLSRRFRNDIDYSMLFSLALFAFYEGWEAVAARRKWLFYSLFWLCSGLACLVKGPAGLLPLAIIIVFLLATKSWRRVDGRIFFICCAVFFAVAGPYAGLLAGHNDFAQFVELLKSHTIMKRSAGLLYYVPVLPAKFFPGSLLLLACVPLFWKKRREVAGNPRLLFLLVWSGLYLVLLHCIKAKVYRYLLPAFPALALITAWGAVRALPLERWAPLVKRFWKIPAALVCIGFPAVICVTWGLSWQAIVLGAAALGLLAVAGRTLQDGVVFLCSLCIACMLFTDVLHTARNSQVSRIRKLYGILQKERIRGDEVLVYKTTGRVRYLLCFYFDELIRPEIEGDLKPSGGIRAVITDSGNVQDVTAVFGSPSGLRTVARHRGKGNREGYTVLFFESGFPYRLTGA